MGKASASPGLRAIALGSLLWLIHMDMAFGQLATRVLVNGYQLYEKLAGDQGSTAFARGYILVSLDGSRTCPPPDTNVFDLEDSLRSELRSRTDGQLRLPGSMLVTATHLEDWQCPPSSEQQFSYHLDLRALLEGLRGDGGALQLSSGYIAGAFDSATLGPGCKLRTDVSLDELVDAVRARLETALPLSEKIPAIANGSPIGFIHQTAAEASFCVQ